MEEHPLHVHVVVAVAVSTSRLLFLLRRRFLIGRLAGWWSAAAVGDLGDVVLLLVLVRQVSEVAVRAAAASVAVPVPSPVLMEQTETWKGANTRINTPQLF